MRPCSAPFSISTCRQNAGWILLIHLMLMLRRITDDPNRVHFWRDPIKIGITSMRSSRKITGGLYKRH